MRKFSETRLTFSIVIVQNTEVVTSVALQKKLFQKSQNIFEEYLRTAASESKAEFVQSMQIVQGVV